jgi:hypothetical protein
MGGQIVHSSQPDWSGWKPLNRRRDAFSSAISISATPLLRRIRLIETAMAERHEATGECARP